MTDRQPVPEAARQLFEQRRPESRKIASLDGKLKFQRQKLSDLWEQYRYETSTVQRQIAFLEKTLRAEESHLLGRCIKELNGQARPRKGRRPSSHSNNVTTNHADQHGTETQEAS